jgi:hypothetical protein
LEGKERHHKEMMHDFDGIRVTRDDKAMMPVVSRDFRGLGYEVFDSMKVTDDIWKMLSRKVVEQACSSNDKP